MAELHATIVGDPRTYSTWADNSPAQTIATDCRSLLEGVGTAPEPESLTARSDSNCFSRRSATVRDDDHRIP